MIDLQLSPAGVASFNAFLDQYAPQYDKQAAALEMIDTVTDRYMDGETMSWEVRASHTTTKRPEIFYLSDNDVIITEVEED
ncbi:MAG: hypothetical protein PSY12_02915 [bacterium]|nr:hypothetical protein [bacterium]